MSLFHTTNSLSEILEKSSLSPIIIFKYSSDCKSSDRLSKKLEQKIIDKSLSSTIYKIVVQKQKALSEKIEEWSKIKHETPQIIKIYKNKVIYTAHHNTINIDNFIYN